MTEKERLRLLEITKIERELMDGGITMIAGMDEVGRGPLAGPVTVACVVLPVDSPIAHVKDSKKLTPKRREELYDQIMRAAACVAVISEDEAAIDAINILAATRRAMEKAAAELNPVPDVFLVDALDNLNLPARGRAIIGGDALCYSIAAASIIAKVRRDRYMLEMDKLYPRYGFARNKGYGTAEHIAAIKAHGPCPIHRKSFLKKILGERHG
ncbi:MAG: ribonuclease HII [Christensenellales bacterium]|jgi:ribonuclease HII